MHIGQRIKELADKKKLSAQKLGNAIGISKQAAYDIFQKSDINTALLKQIAETLGEPISVFFDEKENVSERAISGDGGASATGQAHASVGVNMVEHDELIRLREEVRYLREFVKDKEERIEELKERINELKSR